MSSPDISPIHTRAAAPAPAPSVSAPTIVTLGVSDPEVLQAMSEYPDGPARTNFLVTALKVGVLSLKAARGTLDSDTVRREGDRLIAELGGRLNEWGAKFRERVAGSLSHYFDPEAGVFVERVDRLTKSDGDLASVVRQQVKEAEGSLSRVFDQFIGENSQLLKALDPTGDNQLVAALQRTLDTVVQAQNASILGQFSLDNKDGALVRFLGELTAKHGDLNKALSEDMQAVVAEFSLDKPDSALSRLVGQVEQTQRRLSAELSLDNEGSALKRMYLMLQEHQRVQVENSTRLAETLNAAVQALQARKEEAAKGTRHGLEFEAALGDHLRSLVAAGGDVMEDTGATTGVVSHCKVGDHVITIGPEKVAAGARIVVEAKQSVAYDLRKTLDEADLARRNRAAGVCVFVHSTRTAHASIPAFARYGFDLVVRWDAEDPAHDTWLQAALMVATALSSKAASHDKQDTKSFARIDQAIERVRKLVEDFDEIETSGKTAKNAAEKILRRAELMRETLGEQVRVLGAEFLAVKSRSGEDGA